MKTKNIIALTDKNGVTKKFRINNREFYNDMVRSSDTPEAAALWLALGEIAGHLTEVK